MIDCDFLQQQFENKAPVDETYFYFRSDSAEIEHYIGYLPENVLPYWIGKCDIPGGCEFKSAGELFTTPVFDGKSLQQRWSDVELCAIGGMPVADWVKANIE